MPQRFVIVVSYACLFVLAASGQQPPTQPPPASFPSQTAQQAPASAPSDQRVSWDQMSVGELLEFAERYVRTGRLNEASVLLTLASSKDPQNLTAKVLAGEVAEGQGNMARARDLYREVLLVQKSHFRANLNMGRSWVRSRMWRQAQMYLETAARVAPQDRIAEVQSLLAVVYQGQVMRDEAIAAAEAAVATDPNNAQARQVLIAVYMDLEQYDKALLHTTILIKAAVDRVRARPNDLGLIRQLYSAYGQRLEALRTYHRTLYEQAADGKVTDRVIPGLEREAATTLAQIIDTRLLMADLVRTMTYHDILSLAQRLVLYAPNDVNALLKYADLLQSTRYDDRAIKVYQAVLERDPNNAHAARQLEKLQPAAERPAETAP